MKLRFVSVFLILIFFPALIISCGGSISTTSSESSESSQSSESSSQSDGQDEFGTQTGEYPSASNDEDFTEVMLPSSRSRSSSRTSVPETPAPEPPAVPTPQPPPTAVNHDGEIISIWFSYIDWGSFLQGKTEENFNKQVDTIIKATKSIGANNLIIHATAFGDATYKSDLLPWSSYASGAISKDPGFDPFAVFAERAAAQGVSVEAWVNPMRSFTNAQFASVPDGYRVKQWWNNTAARHRYMIQDSGGRWWLNPANPEVRSHIAEVCGEIAAKYQVRAVHIDDYFYPTGLRNTNDDLAYYNEQNPGISIENWRRSSTKSMIKQMHDAIKAADSSVLFGISPSGNIDYNLNTMFVDFASMLGTAGYMDYIAPQIYFGFNNAARPFEQCLTEWNAMVTEPSIRLHVGLAAYKIGQTDEWAGAAGKDEWIAVAAGSNDMLSRKIQYSRTKQKYAGVMFFAYNSFFTASGEFQPATKREIENIVRVL
ncbi:MAG: family 10 glycosylhydrolase [Oscillospiraceae bacterium]|nr:family 10 glycosylhydrolase [Oscillospiraceae bacterium]